MSATSLESHKDMPMALKGSCESYLLDLAREGHREAFDELCLRHIGMAKRIANRILRHHHDVEDVIQDSLLRAFLHLPGFDGRSKFSTWLTQITINTSLMALRRRRIHREVPCDDDVILNAWSSGYAVGAPPAPDAVFSRLQQQHMLDQATKKLPKKLQYPIILRHKEELQVEEVAQRLNISVAAAKSRLWRANIAIQTTVTKRLRARPSTASKRFHPTATDGL